MVMFETKIFKNKIVRTVRIAVCVGGKFLTYERGRETRPSTTSADSTTVSIRTNLHDHFFEHEAGSDQARGQNLAEKSAAEFLFRLR